jgi:hypothetical protein
MSRPDSDETYVLGLCDEALGTAGLRRHRFDWLVGDPDGQGRRIPLPVDAYWSEHRIVVEYHERLHEEPVAHFDKPDRPTVGGVHRGEQRALYDARRRTEIPAHGLRLVEISHRDLAADPRGRLHRERDADLKVVKGLLIPEAAVPRGVGDEARVLEAFRTWLVAEGWQPVRPADKWTDIEAVRGDQRLIGEAKGHTASKGLDVDTGYGRLLRRMTDDAPGIRYALIVPTAVLSEAERVPAHVRRRLGIDLYEVTDTGAVVHRANWRL